MNILLLFFIIVFVYLSILSSVWWRPFLLKWMRRKMPQPHDPYAPIVQMVSQAIIGAPDQWEGDHYRLSHEKLGASVWIANERYGLKLSTKGLECNTKSDNNVQLTEITKDVLWDAVKFWKQYRAAEDARAFADKVRNTFWKDSGKE